MLGFDIFNVGKLGVIRGELKLEQFGEIECGEGGIIVWKRRLGH